MYLQRFNHIARWQTLKDDGSIPGEESSFCNVDHLSWLGLQNVKLVL